MTKKLKDPEILNPRYEGATPGMVARALAQPVKEADQEGDGDKPLKSCASREGKAPKQDDA